MTNTIRRLYAEWRFRRFRKRWEKAFGGLTDRVESNGAAIEFVRMYYKDDALPEWMWEQGKGWVHRPKDDAND